MVTVPQKDGSERVFLLGGAQDEGCTKGINECFEVILKKKVELKRLANLPLASTSFGACVSEDGNLIYIAGGSPGDPKQKPLNETYAYDIEKDKWTKIGQLNQPRFSCSLILF